MLGRSYKLEAIENGWLLTYPKMIKSIPYECKAYLSSMDEAVEFIKNNERKYFEQQPQVKES